MGVGDICRQEINTQKVKNRAQPIRERGQAGETEKTTPGASEGRRKGRCWAPSAAGGLQARHRARHPSTLQTDDFTLLLHLTTTLGCCRSGQARPGWSRGPGAGGHTAPEPTLPASPAAFHTALQPRVLACSQDSTEQLCPLILWVAGCGPAHV